VARLLIAGVLVTLSIACGALVHGLAAGVRAGDSDAAWLRARHAARGSLADVVREACTRWEKTG